MASISPAEWKPVLERLNTALRAADVDGVRYQPFRDQIAKSPWYPPCSEHDLKLLEARIQVEIPASYRSFLLTTNGWGPIDRFIWRMLPASEVDWLHVKTPELAGDPNEEDIPVSDEDYLVYGERQRPEFARLKYLQRSLQVSDVGDAAVVLLNPAIRDVDGEWEAWWFAPWNPGADRYRSFFELMQAELNDVESP